MINTILKRKCKKDIITFFNSNFSNDDILNIVSPESLSKFSEYYLYYPLMFIDGFTKISSEKVKILNHAGFLSYRAIIIKDNISDSHIDKSLVNQQLKIADTLLQKSQLELLKIFPKESLFWDKWKIRKEELDSNILIDQEIKKKFSYKKFIDLAWRKSAFAKLAIDGLFILENCQSVNSYKLLLESHKHFSVAMQLFDDMIDINEDDENNQFSIAKYYTILKLKEKGIKYSNIDKKDLEKHLYLSGVANYILQKALKHIDYALENVLEIEVLAWKNVLLYYKKLYSSLNEGIDTYIEVIKSEVNNSNELLFLSENEINIEESISRAKKYIINKQHLDGSWTEYLTSAGTSNIWASSFILFFAEELIDKSIKNNALNFLYHNSNPLWGYKKGYVNDNDSTVFTLINLFREDYKIKNKIGSLLKFQNNDGGFATYNIRSVYALRKKMRMDKGQSYEGWLQSHICVSSVIFYLANISNASITVISKLISFLTSNLSKKNLCYWWTSNIYTLFFLSKSINYVPVDSQLYQILFELFENTINEQHDDGSFGDSYFKNSPFYTGLMVLTIINFKNANSLQLYNNQLNNAVRYLLKSQMEDGSWLQTNAMKLPFPDDIHSFDKNWKVAEFGCNVRAPEYNRLFTSSVCLKAIYEYYKLYEH